MSEKEPKVIIFDLDYTLWPFWVDTHVSPPFKKGSNNKITDTAGKVIKHYPDSTDVLKQLSSEGYKLGVASRTSEIRGANQLVELFGWEKYFSYKEIYPGCKVAHLTKIKNEANVEFADMLFFDDEQRNISDCTKIGVMSILVKDGVTQAVIRDGLKKFSKNL